MVIEAWRVHDSGLVAAPGPFRRLPGRVRHHRGDSPTWPDRVRLDLDDGELVVTAGSEELGRWAVAHARARVVTAGPPVSFVLELPEGAQLLAAASVPETEALLDALGA